jgi:predicted metal-binding membrane protein
MNLGVEAALRRHRAITFAALALLVVLAWGWLIAGAGTGMEPLVSLAPPVAQPQAMPGMDMAPTAPSTEWTAAGFAVTWLMWWVMMVAMMLPSAAPTILLYDRAATHAQPPAHPASANFLLGYLLAWGLFSLSATALQSGLERSDLVTRMLMASQSRTLSGAILIAAGIYQLSPLKDVCLRHCRSPADFLTRHYQPGALGALRMGLLHGSYCVGCCWLLMALLFVGGVMNLAWIALLTLLVAGEKLLPFGRQFALVAGLGCIAWGAAILAGIA